MENAACKLGASFYIVVGIGEHGDFLQKTPFLIYLLAKSLKIDVGGHYFSCSRIMYPESIIFPNSS